MTTTTTTKKKAYAVAMVIQVISAAMTILSKAAFNRGLSTFVFVFYRLAAASLFLLPMAIHVARFSSVFFNSLCRSILHFFIIFCNPIFLQEKCTAAVSPVACKDVLVRPSRVGQNLVYFCGAAGPIS
jgi:hypothetical protein